MDKSGANTAAMDEINTRGETQISVRQVKYLNNIVEQDQRAVKRVTKVKMCQVQTPWGRINKRRFLERVANTHAKDVLPVVAGGE